MSVLFYEPNDPMQDYELFSSIESFKQAYPDLKAVRDLFDLGWIVRLENGDFRRLTDVKVQ